MSNKRPYQWLLFDLDNTILDFTAKSRIAFSALLNDLEIKEEAHFYKLYKEINGHIWWQLEKEIITQSEVRHRRFKMFFNVIGIDVNPHSANEIYFKHLVEDPKFIQNAEELIPRLAARFNLVIITNGMKEVQHQRIDNADIRKYFKHIVISDEIGSAKPHEDFFNYTLKEIGNVDLAQILIIGDTLTSDIEGGINYGIDSCWFNPNSEINNTEINPSFEINLLSELMDIVNIGM